MILHAITHKTVAILSRRASASWFPYLVGSCAFLVTVTLTIPVLGRYADPTMVDPAAITEADYLIVESTYGNREARAS